MPWRKMHRRASSPACFALLKAHKAPKPVAVNTYQSLELAPRRKVVGGAQEGKLVVHARIACGDSGGLQAIVLLDNRLKEEVKIAR